MTAAETLPPFSHNPTRCVKCGDNEAHTTWMEPLIPEWLRTAPPDFRRQTAAEHLLRECRTCGFRWAEAVQS